MSVYLIILCMLVHLLFHLQPSSTESEEGMISMAISSHYFFGEDKLTPQLNMMLKRFPLWAFPSSWVSTYNLYRY